MKKKKKLVPLSQLLDNECLGDIAKYSDSIYVDVENVQGNKSKIRRRKHNF